MMKIVCTGGELDIDALNAFDPDGKGAFCEIRPAGYGMKVPDTEKGTFLVASDNGRIKHADIAFKMMLDAGLRMGLANTKYLAAEAARSAEKREPHMKNVEGAIAPLLSEVSANGLCLPDLSACVAGNLAALREYDMIGGMASVNGAGRAAASFLNGYLWLGRGTRSFTELCKAVTGLLNTMTSEQARVFITGFYAALDGDFSAEPEVMPDDGTDAPVTEEAAAVQEEAAPDEIPAAAPAKSIEDLFRDGHIRVKGLSASDITGMDEAYSYGYREEQYQRDLSLRDSEGFFEGVLKSRLNGTPAPIDILTEVVAAQTSVPGSAMALKDKLAEMAEDAKAAVDDNA